MNSSRRAPVVIAGVTGSGKTTVADCLARLFGWSVVDADLLHSAENIRKMSSGVPLTDEDRWPWLARVADVMASAPNGLVVACSALRRAYRTFLADRLPDAQICLLEVDPETAAHRLALRRGHFMDSSLLASQFADLEPLARSERGFTVDGNQRLTKVLADVVAGLQRSNQPIGPRSKKGLPNACADC